MEEHHEHCDNHTHSDHIRYRTRWIFSLIFIPVSIFLIRPFAARQILYRASAYNASNMHQESIRQYRKALFIDADNAEGWNGLADVYKNTGITEEAIHAYKKALESDPLNRKALYSLGMIFAADKEQYEEAARYWNQVKQLGPESADEKDRYPVSYYRFSLLALATYYRRVGDADGEASIWQELHTYYPDESKVEEQIQATEDDFQETGEKEKADTSP